MLESILNPKEARNNMLEVFVVSAVFTIVSAIFSYYLFPKYSSVLICAFITVLFAPFFQRMFSAEEAKEEFAARHGTDKNLFQRHAHVLKIYSAYFLGVIVMTSLIFAFLPVSTKTVLFDMQISEVERLSGMSVTGNVVNFGVASGIFANNVIVLMFAFILSFLFGTGAIFILSWNASVIAVYVGGYVNSLIARGMVPGLAYVYGMPYALLSITMHGIPEIFGYFFAGMAGGILSVGIIHEKIGSRQMKKVFFDSLILLGFGVFSLFVGAFIETGSLLLSSVGFVAYLVFLTGLCYYGKS